MNTTHTFVHAPANSLSSIGSERAALVVTSPPYPLITMWDDVFSSQSEAASQALKREDGKAAFEAMHVLLDEAWETCRDNLIEGGLLCINIGDTVRTFDGGFQLFSNYARVITVMERLGLTILPSIIWRKPANSPTKFMGSGMLPGGAYVTLEHEHILIARKGGLRRPRSEDERLRRRRSAIFWEERNEWYSDLWTLRGVRQPLTRPAGHTAPGANPARHMEDGGTRGVALARERSAAFPLELAYRLMAMHSWEGDLVTDPFAGTGTTAAAAMALGRSSLSLDSDARVLAHAYEWLESPELLPALRARSEARLEKHATFLEQRDKPLHHTNGRYDVPVVTSQETDLEIPRLSRVTREQAADEAVDALFICSYD